MSSLQRQQMSLPFFESGSKKKFGKNLNKIQKPAPPITNSGTNKAASSKNGLLLLSTKRSTSTVGNLSSSGLLSSKAATTTAATKTVIQPAGVRNDFYTSTHDALLDAVSGINRKDKEQQPDAWRVSDKPDEESDVPALLSQEDVSSIPEPVITIEVARDKDDSYERNDQPPSEDRQRCDSIDGEVWRRQQRSFEAAEGSVGDTTQLHMSMLARERAERIRKEEETRMNEQRERALQRLRELEEKMALPASSVPEETQPGISPVVHRANGVHGESHNSDSEDFQRREIAKPRTLFDPSRTYSSLVGKTEPDTHQEPQNKSVKQDHVPLEKDTLALQNLVTNDELPESQVIHLASYDDRDRGENRGKTATPRMLFDPRSGSMVAVSTEKEKKGKLQPKARVIREPLTKGDPGEFSKQNKKNCKGRKDDALDNRKAPRGRGNSVDSSSVELKITKIRSAKMRPAEQRLPRTCGVLYVRDAKGNIYCADGTDPEQYGSHLVRGGKIRNPAAHAAFLEEQQLEERTEPGDDYAGGMEYERYDNGYGLNGKAIEIIPAAPEMVELVKGDDKIELLTGAPESPTLKATAMEWAPSQSAIAAAAAAKEVIGKDKFHSQASIESIASGSVEFLTDDESEDVDPTSFVGLGFDPTENMDSVMASPTSNPKAAGDFGDGGLASLSIDTLNPSISGATTQNYFAFGLSGTWGSGGGAPLSGNSGNWSAVLGAVNEKPSDMTPSFISLSSNNTWGSGFGGLSGGATVD